MEASDLESIVNLLIDDLTPTPAPNDAAERRLCHLLDSPRRVVDDERLLAVLDAAVSLCNMSNYLLSQATAAAERAGTPKRQRVRTAAQLLTARGVDPGAALRAARVGGAAHSLPALTQQQRLGAVGIEFADAVGRGVTLIHKRVELSDADRAQVVRALMIETTPKAVTDRAREIAIEKVAALPAPAEGEEEPVPVAENADLNEMTMHQNAEGRTSVAADLDAVTAEELFAALDALCRPVPLPDGSPDPRSVEQRRADAFGQVLRTYLSNSSRPTSGGVLPHVTLTRPTTAAILRATGSVDMLGFTGPISAATADLVSCDSTATTVLVDHHGAPLDVGRSERLFPPHIRKALAIRDGGCAFPGCGRPVSWCDAHHLTPWAAGGSTCVDNGVMLCRRHHTMIHQTDWQVYLGPDRHPWFIPPYDRTGPEPEHLRSHGRRTLTLLPAAA